METKKYLVKGDHPVLKRIDRVVSGIPELITMLKELFQFGYEIEIEMYKANLENQFTGG